METSTCYLDLFCMRRGQVDIEILKKIVTCPDPERYGLWERLVTQKYGKFMPNVVTACIRYAVNRTKDPYINVVFIFFVCLGFEPACQRIITKQLERAGLYQDNVFFTQEFVKFAYHTFTVMMRYPITQEDAVHVFTYCVSVLQTTWLTKSTYFSIISTTFERTMRDNEMKRRSAEAKAKEAARAPGRIKRERA